MRKKALDLLINTIGGDIQIEDNLFISHEVYMLLVEYMKRGKKIQAIKTLREETNMDLRDAKDWVEKNIG